jgi:hypothetical protein
VQISDRIDTAKPPRRRAGRVLLVVALVIVVALWAAYWFAAHWLAATALERTTTGPIAGHRIACTDEELSGFPLRVDLRCQRASYADVSESLNAAIGGLSASAPLYRPGYVAATLISPLEVNIPAQDVALTASWSAAIAHATAWLDGLRGGGASFISLDLRTTGESRSPLPATLAADSAALDLAPTGGDAYRLTGTAKRLRLTQADGNPLPEIDAAATVTLVGLGSTLGTNPARTIVDWLRAGATVNLERLRLALAGAVFVADGSLTLSPDGVVNGSVLLSYNSIDALADLIETLRPGTRERYSMPLQVFNALSKSVSIDGESFRQTPLTFTDSVVWVGIVPLPDPIPPLRF